MAKLYNLARMTTATTGTGTITLGSAVSGWLSFALAGVQDGETITYGIRDGAHSEIGRGVYTVSGTTLSRSVLKSTNSDSAISLSGSAEVFITAAAEDLGAGPWLDWTPVLTASVTNPTLGSGSVQFGRYKQVDKTVHLSGKIQFGTSGTNAGSGNYHVSLPVSAHADAVTQNVVLGQAELRDDNPGVFRASTARIVTSTTFVMASDGSSTVTHAAPHAWAASDWISFSFSYEAA